MKWHKKRLVIFAVLTLFITTAIFLMSAQDGGQSGSLSEDFLNSPIGLFLQRFLPRLTDRGFDYDIRKYGHMFEYFALGFSSFLFTAELFLFKKRRELKASAAALGFCFLYACSDEFHQRFVPGRAGCFSDVLIDSAGFITAIIIMTVFFALFRHFLDKKLGAVYHENN